MGKGDGFSRCGGTDGGVGGVGWGAAVGSWGVTTINLPQAGLGSTGSSKHNGIVVADGEGSCIQFDGATGIA